MAMDVHSPRSRRALLGASLGAAGALVANALGRAAPVSAADGETVVVGGEYNASSPTKITMPTSAFANDAAMAGFSTDRYSGSMARARRASASWASHSRPRASSGSVPTSVSRGKPPPGSMGSAMT